MSEYAWTNQRYSFSGTLYKTEIRDRPKDQARLNCLIAFKASKKVKFQHWLLLVLGEPSSFMCITELIMLYALLILQHAARRVRLQ
jgi:hypothetical protein